MEKDLFIRLAMCTDPRKIEASGLSKRVMRSLGIGVEDLDPEEKRHREGLRKKIFKEIGNYEPGETLMPGFGPHPGFPEDRQVRVELSAEHLFEVGKKIVRGCEYILGKSRIVDPPYEVSVHMAEESEISDVLRMFAKFAPLGPADLGPGFQVQRATPNDEPNVAMFRISIWNTWRIYGGILPPE
jgi:hypothetical protein